MPQGLKLLRLYYPTAYIGCVNHSSISTMHVFVFCQTSVSDDLICSSCLSVRSRLLSALPWCLSVTLFPPYLSVTWPHVCVFGRGQVYDVYEDSSRPLRQYSEQEVAADPLIILSCGHVLPMSSMDGFLDLERAYSKDKSGKWTQACLLQVAPV